MSSEGTKTRFGIPRHTRNNPRPFASEDADNSGKWSKLKAYLVAASGEFLGTFFFLYFAFGGTQVAAMSGSG